MSSSQSNAAARRVREYKAGLCYAYHQIGTDYVEVEQDDWANRSHTPDSSVNPEGCVLISPQAFERYIGIDYSGAETATSSLRGLRVYQADRETSPGEVLPLPGAKKYWTRRGIAEWLALILSPPLSELPALVGIDHGFSFPLRYFVENQVPLDWRTFLDDFQRHWPTDQDHTYVDFVRDGLCGNAPARSGNSKWRRVTEVRARRAKSVFHFDVQGSVAKSTHSGLPWLRFLDLKTTGALHFWPFDGWNFPAGKSVVAEVYPALWSKTFAQDNRDGHQHDAYSIAAWMRQADKDASLSVFANPPIAVADREAARIEGWILGVM